MFDPSSFQSYHVLSSSTLCQTGTRVKHVENWRKILRIRKLYKIENQRIQILLCFWMSAQEEKSDFHSNLPETSLIIRGDFLRFDMNNVWPFGNQLSLQLFLKENFTWIPSKLHSLLDELPPKWKFVVTFWRVFFWFLCKFKIRRQISIPCKSSRFSRKSTMTGRFCEYSFLITAFFGIHLLTYDQKARSIFSVLFPNFFKNCFLEEKKRKIEKKNLFPKAGFRI